MKEAFEKIKERLEEELVSTRETQTIECKGNNGYGTPLQAKLGGEICALLKSIKIVNQVAEEYKQGWIPCSERLPDKTMLCLCTVERGVTPYHGLNPIIDWWIGKEDEQVSLFEGRKGHWKTQCNKVIAWQPLPEPYKGE